MKQSRGEKTSPSDSKCICNCTACSEQAGHNLCPSKGRPPPTTSFRKIVAALTQRITTLCLIVESPLRISIKYTTFFIPVNPKSLSTFKVHAGRTVSLFLSLAVATLSSRPSHKRSIVMGAFEETEFCCSKKASEKWGGCSISCKRALPAAT